MAEILYDIDFKDGKFGRPETAGITLLMEGIMLGNTSDMSRIDEGALAFDALYASKRAKTPLCLERLIEVINGDRARSASPQLLKRILLRRDV